MTALRVLALYLATAALLLLLDGIWLTLVGPFYREQLGALMRPQPDWYVAGGFYLGLVVGLLVLAVRPARHRLEAIALGALFGACTYGTYDLTNLATLRDWPILVTAVDLCWGTALCAALAAFGYSLRRRLRPKNRQ